MLEMSLEDELWSTPCDYNKDLEMEESIMDEVFGN